MTIIRPDTKFDAASHTYTLDGEELMGVSTVAKIGGAESTWGVASAWGFRLGYEGAWALMEGEDGLRPATPDALRGALKDHGLTPWSTRDRAADRGTWVHDLLEQLGQEGESPTADLLAGISDEYRGHAKALLAWYLDYRPSFEAVEVQVTSVRYGFGGRYDIRCRIEIRRLLEIPDLPEPVAEHLREMQRRGEDVALCLVDEKTSKDVYPLTHLPQLEGYEGASVEMGFPATDVRLVLNTHPDGTYRFVASWSTYEDFLAYLGALKAIRRVEAEDPERKRKVAREQAILLKLPGRSAELARTLPELAGMDGRGVGILMSGLRKRGLVEQGEKGVWALVVAAG